MKGELHERLRALLQAEWQKRQIKQEALGEAMGKSQRSISQYLNHSPDAGALDLDEADIALRHIGSSLAAFLANQPPRTLTHEELVARRLETRPDLIGWVEALLGVPRKRLPVVLDQINAGVYAATGRRLTLPGGSGPEKMTARRTTKGPKKRR